jgi:hypothetical protein
VLRFEVSGATLALVNEALVKLRADAEEPLEEEEALALMARMVLGAGRESGTSSYQIAVVVCEDCDRGWQQGKGELVRVTPDVVAMAACDATHIGRVARRGAAVSPSLPPSGGGGPTREAAPSPRRGEGRGGGRTHVGPARASQTVPPRVRRFVLRRDHESCVVPGCRCHRYLDVHHIDPRAEGGGHDRCAALTTAAVMTGVSSS